MDIFDIFMDTSIILNFLALPINEQIRVTLVNFGWIPIAWAILWGAKEMWLFYINIQYSKKFKKILLAIDVPRGVDQSLRAMENVFTYLGGAHGTLNLIDIYWEGKYQLGFSFEIISIEGYIQYIVYTPEIYRDLVESAFYSQYPDAEITQVEDYTTDIPSMYPDDTWDLWGGEFVLVKPDVYPIPSYKTFESVLSGRPETQFKDPIAALMDCFSSMGPGEQAWYQILIKPVDVFHMAKPGQQEISRILKEKVAPPKNIIDKFIDWLMDLAWEASEIVYSFGIDSKREEAKQDDALKMMNLKPLEKKQIESIQEKCRQLNHQCKIRYIYLAKKDVINKSKGAGGFVGFMKQFVDNDINNIKPDMAKTITTANYFFVKQRIESKKRKIVSGYKDRDSTVGRTPFYLSVEELATLWHFPVEAISKPPLLQKAPGRKSEGPMTLPFSERTADESTVLEEDIFSGADREIEARKSAKAENGSNRTKEEEIDEIFSMEDASGGRKEKPDSPGQKSPNTGKGAPPENLPFA